MLVAVLCVAATPVPNPTPTEAPAARTLSAYLNDWADILTDAEAEILDEKLRLHQEATTNQVVVAIYDELPSEPMETFTRETANRWGVGQRAKDNGAVLFIFMKSRALRLEVGYGLEGRLTPEKAQAILDEVVKPRFKQRDYAGGIAAGVDAVFEVITPR